MPMASFELCPQNSCIPWNVKEQDLTPEPQNPSGSEGEPQAYLGRDVERPGTNR